MNIDEQAIEAAYPLSPMQQGMLFHSLREPESGLYVCQAVYTLRGKLDLVCFERAWQQVVDRHAILRTAFSWKQLRTMVQVVRRTVRVPIHWSDSRSLSSEAQSEQLQNYLEQDRQAGFELAKAPLLRVGLFQLGEELCQMVLTFHHALLDAWSYALAVKEVGAYYQSYLRGKQLELPQPLPYREYIAWLQEQDLARAEVFWRQSMQGIDAPTPLPLDTISPRTDLEGAVQGKERLRLTESSMAQLHALVRQTQLTLNTVIQGMWALLLSRYSGERKVIFGATVSGRTVPLPGIEEMIGLFINTLPVSVSIESSSEVGAWLKRLQAEQAEAQQFAYAPLVEIHKWSEIPGGVPLFESILDFTNQPVDVFEERYGPQTSNQNNHGSLWVEDIHTQQAMQDYALGLVVSPQDGLEISLTYDRHRFESESIKRLLRQLIELLERTAANPTQRLSELTFLTDAEREQLLVAWNHPHEERTRKFVHQLIEDQAATRPETIALDSAVRQMTYAELNTRANQVAHHLLALGVNPELKVALYFERGWEMIVALLAVLKTGGAYVPLDLNFPAERLAYILDDALVSIVLTQESLRDSLPTHWAQVVCLDSDWDQLDQESTLNLEQPVDADNLAYLIYTSGSTGWPKGVALTYGALASRALTQVVAYDLTESDRCLQFLSPAFDAFGAEVFPTVSSGATLVLTPDPSALSPLEFLQMIQQQRLNVIHLPAAYWHQLADYLQVTEQRVPDSLRLLVIGGDVLSLDMLRRWMTASESGTRVINVYGPTEATISTTHYEVPSNLGDLSRLSLVPIGRPIANTQVYVLDADLQLCPVNAPGELFIAGAGLARGYLNQPDLTAEKFLPNLFAGQPGQRLYRTGDRVRWNSSGELEFLGRVDQQVKLRGYRIELDEVEAVLKEHRRVRQSAVLLREDEPGEKRLVAYVVPQESSDGAAVMSTTVGGTSAAAVSIKASVEGEPWGDVQAALKQELKQYLVRKLPEYMVPSAIVLLDQMPLTTSHKVNRRALPPPDERANGGAPVDEAPRTRTEEVLIEIWSQVLKLDHIGLHDDFFELGGHSLLATQVVSRIRRAFKVDLPLHELFDAPTVAGLARQLDKLLSEGQHSEGPLVVPVGRGSDLPLSFAQQRLWLINQLDPNSAVYNASFAWRLKGDLNVAALQRSLDEIVRRHEVLRTSFQMRNGEPLQQIAPPSPVSLSTTDFSALNIEEREARAHHLANEEARKPFDLSRGPLLRVHLIRLASREHVLLVNMHHIVGDGWSGSILTREFAALYEAYLSGGESPLPELPVQYADFAAWQRNHLQGDVLERLLGYWRQQLSGMTPLALPTDYPRPAIASYRGATLGVSFPAEVIKPLKELGRHEGATLFMTLLAAFQILLGRYTGLDDVATGTAIANRNRLETEGLIGFFLNMLVLRTNLQGDPSFRQLLRNVRQTVADAYQYQDLPFDKLVAELSPERDLSRPPLFQIVFALQNTPPAEFHIPGLELSNFTREINVSRLDLTLALTETEAQGVEGVLEYATELFKAETMQQLVERLRVLLESVASNPDQRISRLPTTLPSEKQAAHGKMKDPGPEYRCVHQLFAEQAQKTPNAIALVYEDQSLTYGELNQRANQLGHYLRNLGVGPEVRVALYLERGFDLIIGLLGVLKAGGAYLNLDPEYPADRLARILDDALPPVIITHGNLRNRLPSTWAQLIFLDEEQEQLAEESTQDPVPLARLSNLAYVIYTSGSTGSPKGVCVEHKGLVNIANAQKQAFQIQPDWAVLQFAASTFDAATWEWMMSLLAGARLVLAPRESLMPGPALAEVLTREAIAVATLPPSGLAVMTEQTFPALQTLIVGGEPCSSEVAGRWSVGRRMFNVYGPTETTIVVTISEPLQGADTPGLGQPIANAQVYVLDADFQICPVNVPGEFFIAGAGLARGYLNQPDLTAEKFLPNPFAGQPGQRLYRTGDRVRWTSSGELEFLGRVDQQVKLRGYRIELGEVEAVLKEHRRVRQSVVMMREDKPGEKRLVAYVVPQESSDAAAGHTISNRAARSNSSAPSISHADAFKLPNGMLVSHLNRNETTALYEEIFQRQTYQRHGITLASDACIFDVGANIGIFTLYASEQSPQGRIYAFEPIAEIRHHLEINAGQCEAEVKVYACGLGARAGEESFTYYPRFSGMSSASRYAERDEKIEMVKQFLNNEEREGKAGAGELLAEVEEVLGERFKTEERRCHLRRLSDVIKEERLEWIDLLKVDVEGAELDVLEGIDEQDWRKIGQVVVEAHDRVAGKGGRVEKLAEELRTRGYDVEVEQDEKLAGTILYNVYGRRRENERAEDYESRIEQSSEGASWTATAAGLEQELKEYLANKLPQYMLPSAIVFMEQIPQTASHKVDRLALPPPEELMPEAPGDWQAPHGTIEELLAGIWATVLKVERIGRQDKFFQVGGHSLLATQVASRIREVFKIELPLRTLFASLTLAELAEEVEAAMHADCGLETPPILPVSREQELPLSFAQQRLWFLDQFEPGSTVYNLPLALRLTGNLDVGALEQSLSEVVRRHEALRTHFIWADGRPLQKIMPPLPVSLQIEDLNHLPVSEREAFALREAQAEATRPFDLSERLTPRVRLLKLDQHEYLILLTMHHIVSDGWSIGVLVREIAALYQAFLNGQGSPLPELSVQYADFAVWQHQWLQGEVLERQLAYWKQQLEGLPILQLPSDRERPAILSERGSGQSFALTGDVAEQLKQLGRREGATLFMVLLAAFEVVLNYETNQLDIVVGTDVANRNRAETENLIGFFVNQLVLRTDLSGDPTFVQLLKRVREVTLAAYAHQDLPFDKLVEALNPPRLLNRTPLFQVKFVLQNAAVPSLEMPGLKINWLQGQSSNTKFDLLFNLWETSDGIAGVLQFSEDLFEARTVEQMLARLELVTKEVAANPEASLNDLKALLTQHARQRKEAEQQQRRERHRVAFESWTPAPQIISSQD